jgi:peptidyl-prolyl cis-trans isomerase C
MNLSVNGVDVPAEAIAREAAELGGGPGAEGAARRRLAIRELLLQRAGEIGLLEGGASRDRVSFASPEAEEEVIARLLDAEVATPEPSEDECRRYFAAHPERYTAGDLVVAWHILFAVTQGTPVTALRAQAERTLAELRAAPELFDQRARELSNCPSGAEGGNLGQFGRGEMVQEFDKAVFETTASGVLPVLVTTRYGFHVVMIDARLPGRAMEFETAREQVARFLAARVQERALRQYVQVLAGKADIRGARLDAAATPLVQ